MHSSNTVNEIPMKPTEIHLEIHLGIGCSEDEPGM